MDGKNVLQECRAEELIYKLASKSTTICSANVINVWSTKQFSNENQGLLAPSTMNITKLIVLYFHSILNLTSKLQNFDQDILINKLSLL